MTGVPGFSRRRFLGAGVAAGLSVVYLPGIGRVQARPIAGQTDDYEGRLCYNENPLGPAPAAQSAMRDAAELSHRYPDWYSGSLEQQIATHHGLSVGNICVGAGATEVIRLVADAFLGPGDELVTATPTYSQMGNDAVANGATVVHVPLDADYRIDLVSMLAAVGPATRMVSLVNPNNPVATIVGKGELADFLDALPAEALVVVDEAYHDYVQAPTYESCIHYVTEDRPVVVIRTFSKAYGLAGARIGYAVASPARTSLIGSTQLFGTVSRGSQAAAIAALGDPGHVTETVALNDQAKATLVAGFANLGLDYIPSETNFMMFDTGGNAGSVASELGSLGFQVRTGWGMPQHIRVSTGTLAETQGFVAALASIMTTAVPGTTALTPALTLAKIHPNPFNARCRIEVVVPTTERVSLTVFDLAGRRIQSLVDESLAVGGHAYVWDGRDHSGRAVASGTYVLQLIQGEYATSRRVALVK